tara:strand:+ start:254 stop:1600 length:1347 start_codon:yes stop_codon:yes gene_type:complete
MGLRLSSFLLGATTAAADTLEEDRVSAAKSASLGVKALKENYDKVMLENRTLENKVTKNMEALKTFDSTATDAQLFAAATNDTYMNMAVEAAKANPASFKVGDVVQIKEDNASKLTATEMLKAYTTIPSVSKAARQAEESSGNFVSDIRKRVASSAASKAEEQTARAMGVSIEQLRGASEFKRPAFDTGAEFDMAKFQKEKGYDEREKDAKLALLKAEKSGDAKAIGIAKADIMIFGKIKETLTSEQQQFANKTADIKNRYMFGSPEERKAAKPEYDKLMADVRAEALAKKVTKDGEGEGKIPALGTLNTFTSASVARAVAAKHGDLIKTKQLAIVEKADGSVGIDYIGDNETLRRQILETQANAAKNALSLYTDAKGQPFNRDVASVLNSYTSVIPSVVRTDSGAAPAVRPTTPTSTTPAPKTKAEYDAIPKGKQYIDTDGKTKIKG